MLNIAEKYLTAEIPEEYLRAFHKGDLTLLYINSITNEIEINTDIEEEAKREYMMMKEKLKNEENKVKVIPRKKIAPIGSKKASLESNSEKEKDFLKILELLVALFLKLALLYIIFLNVKTDLFLYLKNSIYRLNIGISSFLILF